jgi:hypothetical protein
MFIAALFTIAKLWKQPRCPSTDEWIKKMWYLYTMEFYAAKNENKLKPISACISTGQPFPREYNGQNSLSPHLVQILSCLGQVGSGAC